MWTIGLLKVSCWCYSSHAVTAYTVFYVLHVCLSSDVEAKKINSNYVWQLSGKIATRATRREISILPPPQLNYYSI